MSAPKMRMPAKPLPIATPSAIKRQRELSSPCIVDGCGNGRLKTDCGRGLCSSHYNMVVVIRRLHKDGVPEEVMHDLECTLQDKCRVFGCGEPPSIKGRGFCAHHRTMYTKTLHFLMAGIPQGILEEMDRDQGNTTPHPSIIRATPTRETPNANPRNEDTNHE